MSRLLALAVLLAAAYFAYTWAWPRLIESPASERATSAVDTDPAAAREARRCVDSARGVSDLLGREIRGLAPGTDPAAWDTVFLALTSEVAAARSLCGCAAAACGPAREALDELNELALQINSALRGTSGGWSNPASRQERVDRLLNEASLLLSD